MITANEVEPIVSGVASDCMVDDGDKGSDKLHKDSYKTAKMY